jgi:membrane protein implicated in regulation of membrane protease activity/ribosomal protein S27E
MAGNSSNSISNNVIATVIGGVVLAAGGAVWVFMPKVWTWVINSLAAVWAHLADPASVPTWWLYLLYAICGVAALVLAWRVYEANKKPREPHWTDYQEDNFFGAVWRWHWVGNQLADPWAYCPTCDTVLVYANDVFPQRITLTCETCGRPVVSEGGDKDYLVAKVLRQIDRKARTGEWRNYVEQNK